MIATLNRAFITIFGRAHKKAAHKPESLTRRAALTNISGLLEQFCRTIVGFLISPVIIRNLGAELYGAWSMIGQIQGYFGLTDFRSAGTLKALLVVQQHKDDP